MKNIIFSRKLSDGPGTSIYGLEVAKYVLDDNEFINNAFDIRHTIIQNDLKINDKLLPTKSSIYNSKLFIDKCAICESTDNLDVHHILFQCQADENNNIGHVAKNAKNNLVVLCKKHHQDVHIGSLNITGYILTNNGIELLNKLKKKKRKKK